MKCSDSQAKIAPALVKAINAIEGVKKSAANPFFKSSYANLESVIEASHEALSANGLCVMQGPGPMDGNCLTVTTRLVHESGEWVETDFSIPVGKLDPQSAGSAVTYARRYSLMAMLNMPAVDDDGEAAMVRAPAATKAPAKPALSDRANKLEDALRNAPIADLDKAWAKGSALCAELDATLPERLAELEQLYEGLKDPIPF